MRPNQGDMSVPVFGEPAGSNAEQCPRGSSPEGSQPLKSVALKCVACPVLKERKAPTLEFSLSGGRLKLFGEPWRWYTVKVEA